MKFKMPEIPKILIPKKNVTAHETKVTSETEQEEVSYVREYHEMTEAEKLEALGKSQEKFKKKYHYQVVKHNALTEIIFICMVIAAIIAVAQFIDIRSVRGNGMAPTINEGQYVVVNKLAYSKRMPERGDVITSNGRLYRIIGIPGDKIQVQNGAVYVNGYMADEAYTDKFDFTYPVRDKISFDMGIGQYFVLCDNRDCYDDSRSGIEVSLDDIYGKVILAV